MRHRKEITDYQLTVKLNPAMYSPKTMHACSKSETPIVSSGLRWTWEALPASRCLLLTPPIVEIFFSRCSTFLASLKIPETPLKLDFTFMKSHEDHWGIHEKKVNPGTLSCPRSFLTPWCRLVWHITLHFNLCLRSAIIDNDNSVISWRHTLTHLRYF